MIALSQIVNYKANYLVVNSIMNIKEASPAQLNTTESILTSLYERIMQSASSSPEPTDKASLYTFMQNQIIKDLTPHWRILLKDNLTSLISRNPHFCKNHPCLHSRIKSQTKKETSPVFPILLPINLIINTHLIVASRKMYKFKLN